MSTARLASLDDIKAYLKGSIAGGSEQENALKLILDGVSQRMQDYILRIYGANWTSASRTETLGNWHYGHASRDTLRLAYYPVTTVASLTDSGSNLASSDFFVESRSGIIYLKGGLHFSDEVDAVVVAYTAGYTAVGSGDTLRLDLPDSLRHACLKQVKYEFQPREAGIPEGAIITTRADGSTTYEARKWLVEVEDTMRRFRRKSVIY